MQHLSNWIEIPVKDLPRAKKFYAQLFKAEFFDMKMGPLQYALFPTKDQYNSGALVQGDGYEPAQNGLLVYLNGGDDLNDILKQVKKSGGKVVMDKTFMGEEAGHVGIFIDTEGNRLGLQSMK
ncbi:VOC family protein [Chitinophaga sp. MM2321]|uniref:VOC family protein n=1 Tax=Chitinophaga sp. MM2321 TaxID=3137178 RepID=UPI0032D59F7E